MRKEERALRPAKPSCLISLAANRFSAQVGFSATAAPAPPLSPAAAASGSSASVTVRSAAELRAAVADPAVTSVSVAAHITLDGYEVRATAGVVAGGNGRRRSLTVASDAAACAALPQPTRIASALASAASAPAAAAPGAAAAAAAASAAPLCAIDGVGLSRLFSAHGPVDLTISSLALLGGAALQGAAVAASGGATAQLRGCVVAGAAAAGDGGAAVAVGPGAEVSIVDCAHCVITARFSVASSVVSYGTPRSRKSHLHD